VDTYLFSFLIPLFRSPFVRLHRRSPWSSIRFAVFVLPTPFLCVFLFRPLFVSTTPFRCMPTLHVWNPTTCSLQLVFSRPSSSAEPIRAGSTYQGTSIIRYRCEALTEVESSTQDVPPTSEYEEFFAQRRRVAEKRALHLHALTTVGGIYKDAKPLQVTSYHVGCASSSGAGAHGAGGSSGLKGGTLKVLSVEQEDAIAASPGKGNDATVDRKPKAKVKANKKSGAAATAAAEVVASTATVDAAFDWGSKLVLFERSDTLPLHSEVDLTVQFTGTVHSFDHGGIYAAHVENTTNVCDDAPLLTHLEVRFARCAFPCPDHPQYRLDWQLKSLQLPDTYTTVLTNGEAQGRKVLAAQHAVQYSFAPCGPMPAYIFSFACFAEPLEEVGTTMDIPEFTGDVAEGLKGQAHALSCVPLPVRVLARRQARIPAATLDRVLHVTQEAVAALQRLFGCPLPLLQCRHLDVLLGPTMPFISGMEHHCSIILNETIYQASKKASGGGGGSNAEVAQTELIVHELAHHWMGNALGLPFPVKEGICQVLEQCFGDVILGKPMRKFKPDSIAAGGEPASDTVPVGTSTIQASEKGHEFTGTSYQLALGAMRRLVADRGFEAFGHCLRHVVHEQVVVPTIALEEQGGSHVLRCIGAAVPPPPYLSTENFLRAMVSSL
jgi:hypothetical protein